MRVRWCFGKLCRARYQLYRSQNLQVNIRWKALAEIYLYTMHSFAPFLESKFEKPGGNLTKTTFAIFSRIYTWSCLFLTKCWDCRAVQRGALCRSRRELSNAYLFAKFGFDTAENEPPKVLGVGFWAPWAHVINLTCYIITFMINMSTWWHPQFVNRMKRMF